MPQSCFVISPIGAEGSETRRRADCCLEYIIKPAFERLGFTTVQRIDRSDDAGQISLNIIRRIVEADWCVADLTGNNANVFYEIGIRHAFQKPIIHLTTDINSLPFDTSHQNTITYVHDDPKSHREAIERICTQVRNVQEGDGHVSTPVSVALGVMKLSEKGDDQGQLIAELHERLAKLEARQTTNLGFSSGLLDVGSGKARNALSDYLAKLQTDENDPEGKTNTQWILVEAKSKKDNS